MSIIDDIKNKILQRESAPKVDSQAKVEKEFSKAQSQASSILREQTAQQTKQDVENAAREAAAEEAQQQVKEAFDWKNAHNTTEQETPKQEKASQNTGSTTGMPDETWQEFQAFKNRKNAYEDTFGRGKEGEKQEAYIAGLFAEHGWDFQKAKAEWTT